MQRWSLRFQQEAARLQRLVSDLQELSRVEAGSYDLHRLPLNLGPLIKDVTSRLRRQFDDKGVVLRVQLPPGLLMVEAGGGRIWAESAGVGQGSQFSFTLPIAGYSFD